MVNRNHSDGILMAQGIRIGAFEQKCRIFEALGTTRTLAYLTANLRLRSGYETNIESPRPETILWEERFLTNFPQNTKRLSEVSMSELRVII